MLITLIKYWQPFVAFLATSVIAYGAHTLHVNYIEMRHEHELSAQAEQLAKECQGIQEAAQDASRRYQAGLADLNSRLDAARRMHGNTYTDVLNRSSASRSDAAAGEAGHVRLDAGVLIGYAGKCEGYRQQVIGLQDFVTSERAK